MLFSRAVSRASGGISRSFGKIVIAPPFHPWCRCCTAPYFEDMEGIGERYARDAVTGERYKLPKDTTYKQWKEMQDAAHGAGTVEKMRKMSYNESADKKQFDAYKARLGDEAPKTFEDFQKLKYDSPTAYNDLCGLYSYKAECRRQQKRIMQYIKRYAVPAFMALCRCHR